MHTMNYNWHEKLILIVDDKKINFDLLKTQLRRTGASFVWLENGALAVDYIKNGNRADLILMDIRMPVMDGIEASKAIKEIRPEIPIVIQTASVMGSAYDEISSSKCDDTIFKPIDANKLIDIVAKQFDKYTGL